MGTPVPDNAPMSGFMGSGKQMGTEQDERKVRSRRRLWRWLWITPCALALFSIVQVVVLRFVDPPFSTVMALRQVEAWGQGDWGFRIHYQWRDLDAMAASVPISLVAAEDQRFPLHNGFDLEAIEKAMDHNARGKRLRGGSTISQQVAKNLFLWQGRSWLRKGLEAWFTLLIETLWPKQRILEVYLNSAEWGNGVFGAEAAARHHFGRGAPYLSRQQASLLAAVLPSPRTWSAGRPSAYVSRRANWIRQQMWQLGGSHYLQRL